MGYRSVVDAVFYTRNEEEAPLLKLYVDENFPRNEELRECLTPISAPKVWGYHFICDDVKWYESYTFVQEFNEFVVKFNQLLSENERARPTWAFEFVRLGEDTSDIEEERSDNADFILSVRREIELNI
jgi:hypothetical protein